MKKISLFLAMLITSAFLIVSAACSGSLSTPMGFDIDEDHILTWSAVDGARSYRLEIASAAGDETINDTTRTERYSLARLAEGDYEIRVMAVGGRQSDAVTSRWSDPIAFHKDYETGLLYELINNNTEYQIKRYGTASGSVTIEDVYRNKPVTAIGEGAFRACSQIQNIVIGNNVRTIAQNAFYNCTGLHSVVIPASVTELGESAFQGCSALERVSIPAGVEVIPLRAFAYCRDMKEVQLAEGVRFIDESAFYACSSLKEVTFPNSVSQIGTYAFSTANELSSVSFGSGLSMIASQAFYSCPALRTVTFAELDGELVIGAGAFRACEVLNGLALPEGLTEISSEAFYADTNLDDITLPESVSKIGTRAFSGTKLYRDQISDENEGHYVYVGNWLVAIDNDVRYNLEVLDASVLHEGTVGIAAYTFGSATKLARIELPVSVKYIGEQAFFNNSSLWRLISPENGLKVIDNAAFAYCTMLSNIHLGEGLEVIGNSAFYGCASLDNNSLNISIIPSSVTRIGTYAFRDTALWSAPDESGVIYAGNWVVGFDEATLSDTVQLHEGTVGIADYAFTKAAVSNIIGLNNVEMLGEGAFSYCNDISTISLNNNITEIKPFTFFKCGSLYSVEFPLLLTEIGDYAFYVCDRLSEVDFSASSYLKSIGSHAFFFCTNVKEIKLNRQLEEIKDYAFYQCRQVTELTIPEGVKVIGDRAFGLCESLTSVVFQEGLQEIGMLAFRECSKLTSLDLPDSLKVIGPYAFYRCNRVSDIHFGSGLERIEDFAFAQCGSIRSVVLPAGLQYIGEKAFKNCNNLTCVVLPGSVSSVGAHAFYHMTAAEYLSGDLTIYVSGEISGQWDGSWNSKYRPVIMGCELSEDGYVSAVSVGENSIQNGYIWGGLTAPVRPGYTFLGWSENENATEAEYALNDLLRVPAGTKLYAVWQAGAGEPSAPQEQEPQGPQGSADDISSVPADRMSAEELEALVEEYISCLQSAPRPIVNER